MVSPVDVDFEGVPVFDSDDDLGPVPDVGDVDQTAGLGAL